jgi:hypothetical protein
MADHVRKQIRDAIATAVTGLTTTGTRVFTDHAYPLQQAELPGLLVRTLTETSQGITLPAPRRLQRTVRFAVIAYAALESDVQNTIDQVCKEVEIALAMPNLGIPAKQITLIATTLDISGDGTLPVGRAAMTYECLYFTAENAPDVPR